MQRRSHSNDYFIVIVLMLLFLPFGGFIPLILLYMVCVRVCVRVCVHVCVHVFACEIAS